MHIKSLLLLLLAFNLFAQDYSYSIESYHDENSTRSIKTVTAADFKPSTNMVNGFFEKGSHWIRFEIKNLSDQRLDMVISNSKSHFDTFTYYELNAVGDVIRKSKVDKSVQLQDRDFQTNKPSFLVEIPPLQTKIVIAQMHSNFSFLSSFSVQTEDEFRQSHERENFIYIFYFGACFAIAFYFLTLFFINRDFFYLNYFLFVVFLTNITFVYSGTYAYFDSSWIDIGAVIMPFAYILLLRMSQQILEEDNKLPYFKELAYFFYFAFVAAGVVMIFDQSLGSTLYNVVVLLFFILATSLLIYSTKENRIYFSAQFIYLISMMSLPLMTFEMIPYNDYTKNIMLYGSFIELMLFSFVLANRINKLAKGELAAKNSLLRLQEGQNVLLQQQVSEKTKSLNLLYKELQHRVKNNFQFILTFLWAQKQSSSSTEATEALDQVHDRINSVTLLHDMLDETQKVIPNLQEYIDKILINFKETYPHIRVEYHVCNMQTSYDNSIALGLILNELLTNSVKYAFEKSATAVIKLNIYRKDDKCNFEYIDNGVGFAENAFEDSQGFGHEFIEEFSQKLSNGEVYISGDKGFSFSLTFSENKEGLNV